MCALCEDYNLREFIHGYRFLLHSPHVLPPGQTVFHPTWVPISQSLARLTPQPAPRRPLFTVRLPPQTPSSSRTSESMAIAVCSPVPGPPVSPQPLLSSPLLPSPLPPPSSLLACSNHTKQGVNVLRDLKAVHQFHGRLRQPWLAE